MNLKRSIRREKPIITITTGKKQRNFAHTKLNNIRKSTTIITFEAHNFTKIEKCEIYYNNIEVRMHCEYNKMRGASPALA